MPALGFSGSNLATVAYAEVDGVAGASTVTNSGVTTTRTAAGTYVVVLPTGLTQNVGRDLIFVQPKANNDGTSFLAKMGVVDDSLEATKTIAIFSGSIGMTRVYASALLLRRGHRAQLGLDPRPHPGCLLLVPGRFVHDFRGDVAHRRSPFDRRTVPRAATA